MKKFVIGFAFVSTLFFYSGLLVHCGHPPYQYPSQVWYLTVTNNATGSGTINYTINDQITSLNEGQKQTHYSHRDTFHVHYISDGVPYNYYIPGDIFTQAEFRYDKTGTFTMNW